MQGSESIGGVTAGSKQTFTSLDIDVGLGDYLGAYFTDGRFEKDSRGYNGIWATSGDHTTPTDSATFSEDRDDETVSIYGTGETAATGWGGEFCGVSIDEFCGVTPEEITGV